MLSFIRFIALSCSLLALAACSDTPSTAPPAAPSAAVIVASSPPEDGPDPYAQALEALKVIEAQKRAEPSPVSSTRQAPASAPAIPSPLITSRIDAASPETLATSVNAFLAVASSQERSDVQLAFFLIGLELQSQLVIETQSGRTPSLTTEALFSRAYGAYNGKTFYDLLVATEPLVTKYQSQLASADAAALVGSSPLSPMHPR